MVRLFSLFMISMFSCVVYAGEQLSVTEKELVSKIEERWSYIKKGSFAVAYDFETPAYRKAFTRKMFVATFGLGVDYKFLEVIEVKAPSSTNVASVSVRVETKTAGAKKDMNVIPVVFYEKWLHIDGQWWHSFSK